MTNWETVLVVCSHCRMIRLKQTSTPLRVETLGGLFEVSCNKVVTNACQVIWKNKTNTYFILQCYKPFFQGVGLHCWRRFRLPHSSTHHYLFLPSSLTPLHFLHEFTPLFIPSTSVPPLPPSSLPSTTSPNLSSTLHDSFFCSPLTNILPSSFLLPLIPPLTLH